jgi:hypothetical protein
MSAHGVDRRIFSKGEILMSKLFALVAIVGLGVSIVGCGEAKKPAAPAAPPAAAPAEPAK